MFEQSRLFEGTSDDGATLNADEAPKSELLETSYSSVGDVLEAIRYDLDTRGVSEPVADIIRSNLLTGDGNVDETISALRSLINEE